MPPKTTHPRLGHSHVCKPPQIHQPGVDEQVQDVAPILLDRSIVERLSARVGVDVLAVEAEVVVETGVVEAKVVVSWRPRSFLGTIGSRSLLVWNDTWTG